MPSLLFHPCDSGCLSTFGLLAPCLLLELAENNLGFGSPLQFAGACEKCYWERPRLHHFFGDGLIKSKKLILHHHFLGDELVKSRKVDMTLSFLGRRACQIEKSESDTTIFGVTGLSNLVQWI